jgi:hypothetical protein
MEDRVRQISEDPVRVDAQRGDSRYAWVATPSAAPRYPAAERDNGRDCGTIWPIVV